ncbi:hypothetical protein A249_37272 [Pseudomonas syringae pv. actinidiae ICMP 18804]|uniref:Uncharacterized protein n=1 Tax=Pseudomonas syringae pv. actinidiae ICMP 19096 TaxID=1194405 RepID=A0A656K449_PSESF|nr:hypothetical protein A249_37272 [Pseudomonas syringae pv. actinidiae ICMP 18804]EPN39196.1 hypothetical protein A242_26167 [Pseudomonas syringae pv. actinidiae ICMP 19095]EPN69263.1 hypothetical protein A245_02108 [Pseudomonas syringae pv. actinidiae ICMP 19096]KTC46740.1 hypothetical protein AO250_01180 [Pseudomonas syringae pv. actinidiae ICMP 19497]NAT15770.1 hypothetical protein [Pseudomonas syringae pv. actinidifoliorum]
MVGAVRYVVSAEDMALKFHSDASARPAMPRRKGAGTCHSNVESIVIILLPQLFQQVQNKMRNMQSF